MVRNYKRKTEDRWTKEDLLNALMCIKNNELKINDAARTFGISRATLYRQYAKFIQGGAKCDVNQFRTCGGNPILTKVEEDVLEKTITDLRAQGFTVGSTDIKRICFEYCDSNGIPNQFNSEKRTASDDWYYGFLKRHPSVGRVKSSINADGTPDDLVLKPKIKRRPVKVKGEGPPTKRNTNKDATAGKKGNKGTKRPRKIKTEPEGETVIFENIEEIAKSEYVLSDNVHGEEQSPEMILGDHDEENAEATDGGVDNDDDASEEELSDENDGDADEEEVNGIDNDEDEEEEVEENGLPTFEENEIEENGDAEDEIENEEGTDESVEENEEDEKDDEAEVGSLNEDEAEAENEEDAEEIENEDDAEAELEDEEEAENDDEGEAEDEIEAEDDDEVEPEEEIENEEEEAVDDNDCEAEEEVENEDMVPENEDEATQKIDEEDDDDEMDDAEATQVITQEIEVVKEDTRKKRSRRPQVEKSVEEVEPKRVTPSRSRKRPARYESLSRSSTPTLPTPKGRGSRRSAPSTAVVEKVNGESPSKRRRSRKNFS